MLAGRTRDLAMDRKYLSSMLSPVGAVAFHVARDGKPIPYSSLHHRSNMSQPADLESHPTADCSEEDDDGSTEAPCGAREVRNA